MIMMPYGRYSSSLQFTGHAKFWHPTGLTYRQRRVVVADTHPNRPLAHSLGDPAATTAAAFGNRTRAIGPPGRSPTTAQRPVPSADPHVHAATVAARRYPGTTSACAWNGGRL
jgi:hypothetical protein